jgi:hypothetical protein
MTRLRQRGGGEGELDNAQIGQIIRYSLEWYARRPLETLGDRETLRARIEKIPTLRGLRGVTLEDEIIRGLRGEQIQTALQYAAIAGDAVEAARTATSPEEGLTSFLARENVNPDSPEAAFYREVYKRAQETTRRIPPIQRTPLTTRRTEETRKPEPPTEETKQGQLVIKDRKTLERELQAEVDATPPMQEIEGINPEARELEERGRGLEDRIRKFGLRDYLEVGLRHTGGVLAGASMAIADYLLGFIDYKTKGTKLGIPYLNDISQQHQRKLVESCSGTYQAAEGLYASSSEWEKAAQVSERICRIDGRCSQGTIKGIAGLYAKAGKPHETVNAVKRILKSTTLAADRAYLFMWLGEKIHGEEGTFRMQ